MYNKKRLYNIWYNMKRRCYNKKNKDYKYYGERGIKICDEWLNNYQEFEKWSLNNGYKDDLTIDRIDNNGNYEPKNCKWLSIQEQQFNKRNTTYCELDGVVESLPKLCKKYNIDDEVVYHRIKRGWNVKKALTTPTKKIKTKKTYIYKGEKTTLKELSIKYNINYTTLIVRLFNGWDLEKAINTPIKNK